MSLSHRCFSTFFLFLDSLHFLPFRFSQNFIDIREKERKRGTRGLVSVPPKIPKEFDGLGGNGSDTTRSEGGSDDEKIKEQSMNKFKPEDLLELQEKITKEILSTKLQEKEMHELQVSDFYYLYFINLRLCRMVKPS